MEWEEERGALWTEDWTQSEYKDRGVGSGATIRETHPSDCSGVSVVLPKMKLLLLCLGLTLVCAQEGGNQEVVTSNFDVSKLSGEWYTAMLASDVKERIEENSVMRSFVDYIEARDNSLTFKLHVEIEGECIEYTVSCDETGKNGVCNAIYAGFATITLVEAVYSDYFVFHLINFTNDGTFQMMALYARTPDVSPTLKKRFEELCQQLGIPKDNILDVTNVDPCLHLRGSDEIQSSSAE